MTELSPVDLIFGLFAASNAVRLFAYIPQLVRIVRDTTGAMAISYWTWGLFAVSHLSTVAYAVVVIDDSTVALIFSLNTAFCVAIVGMTAFKRWRFSSLTANVTARETMQRALRVGGVKDLLARAARRPRASGHGPIVPSSPMLRELTGLSDRQLKDVGIESAVASYPDGLPTEWTRSRKGLT